MTVNGAQIGHDADMATPLARLVSLASALVAILVLSLHSMAPASGPSDLLAHAAHEATQASGQLDDADGATACAVHCLLAAVLPQVDLAPSSAIAPALGPELHVNLEGLILQPLGPPPKLVVSA